jgi:hypothetical protein
MDDFLAEGEVLEKDPGKESIKSDPYMTKRQKIEAVKRRWYSQ